MDNPTQVRFAPSTDHATLTRYELRSVVVSSSSASSAVSIGLPTPVDEVCTASLNTTAWTDGVAYRVEIRSVRGTDVSAWEPSSNTGQITEPAETLYGPQASISPPEGAVMLPAGGTSGALQTLVNANPAGTTFGIAAGVHVWTSSITPKSGDVFIGEYGAILDGATWTSADTTQAAFRSSNQAIINVTITNLEIANMPQKGIYANAPQADGWTVTYNEITNARGSTGIAIGGHTTVAHNWIHHNPVGAYGCYQANTVLWDTNEFSHNGGESKVVGATNVTFTNNWVHDHEVDGIWYDTDNTGTVITNNLVEDTDRHGIHYEISGSAVIHDNIVERSGDTGLFISTSKNVDAYDNVLTDNFRGMQLYVNCTAVGGGGISWDLVDNDVYDNTITVPAAGGAWAATLSNKSDCSDAFLVPYLNGSKNNHYTHNAYVVPNLSTKYWYYKLGQSKSFTEWQALGMDTTGSVTL